MRKSVELYKNCHAELGRLYNCRQLPFMNASVENQLKCDKAIIKNGLFASITTEGENMFLKKYYLKLAEVEERKEREIRISQFSVEMIVVQPSFNKLTFAIQIIELCIPLIELIIGVISYCTK